MVLGRIKFRSNSFWERQNSQKVDKIQSSSGSLSKKEDSQLANYTEHNDWHIVNIKQNMPTVDEAMKRFDQQLNTVKRMNVKALIVIHGYGSTGVGGKIKIALHGALRDYARAGRIKHFITGENWSRNNHLVQWLLEEVPDLEYDPELDEANPGITVVVL